MKAVATLFVNPLNPILTEDHVRHVSDIIKSMGGSSGRMDWLDPGIAFDLPFQGPDPQILQKRLMAELTGKPIDIACQSVSARRKKMLIADMDSTIITVECIDELADFAGLKAKVSAITDAAMRGETDFAAALKKRVRLLAGLNETALQDVYDQRVALTAGAETLIRTMRQQGARTYLVSGGFTFFTGRIANLIGFHEHYANRLIIDQGKLTGHVEEPIVTSETKRQKLIMGRTALGLHPSQILAVGDGANDIPMLNEAGLGVAYHAREMVIRAADMAIRHSDLTGLLYIQGYRKTDFTQ